MKYYKIKVRCKTYGDYELIAYKRERCVDIVSRGDIEILSIVCITEMEIDIDKFKKLFVK